MNNRQLIATILDDLNVTYWTSGTNVSRDSINIQCPFSDCDDHSNHLGIFDDSLLFSCWKCRRKGHFSFLLSIISGDSIEECQGMIDAYSDAKDKDGAERILEASTAWKGKGEEDKLAETSPLPEYFERVYVGMNFPLLRRYIKKRKITIEQLVEIGCGVCRVGKYMNRLIIPVRQHDKQVSFTAADMTGQARTPYVFPSMSINNYLYGYDDVQNVMIVTEGVFDKLRVGVEAVAMFGSYLTDIQRSLILKKELDWLVFCLDGDAYWQAKDVSNFFLAYIDRVAVIRVPFEEDPDSLGTREIWKLIEEQLE